ncbi:hypothetical protein BH09ACT13_BH09ACT13_16270 [soil metagenome]
MDTWIVVVIVVAVLAILGVLAWAFSKRRRTEHLKERFGPEYDRTVAETDKPREAEKELLAREERHEELDLRPLPDAARERFRGEWQTVQAQFVDDPEGAVRAADGLVARVMDERGYPTDGDAAARADDLSVEHAWVVGEYRRGHELLEGLAESDDSTERLRESMQCFRKAFEELLEDTEVART